MKVSELIAHLQTFPQDLEVVQRMYSEYSLLEAKDVELWEACPPRADGWVQLERPDIPTQQYVRFPGN